jgi:CelD/BcsL family acetyltransferase involved in cellulose biosynthesis
MCTPLQVRCETRPASFSACVYEGGWEIVDGLAHEWRTLCSEAHDDQPFYRPEWIRAHLRAFFPRAKVLLVAVRRDGHLCLVLPLVREKGTVGGLPVRTLRAPVNGHGGRFDAVLRSSGDAHAAICAAWQLLKEMDVWDLLQFRNTLAGSTIGRLAALAAADGFHAVQVPERPNPYVPVPAELEMVGRLPPNPKLRSQLRQSRRRLSEQGSLTFHRIETADREALQRFYRLEGSGWKHKEGSAILCNAKTRCFYDEMAEAAARFGYFSLYTLEFKDRLIAAHYSFTHRGRCYSPKVAYDEEFRRFAPGHLIIQEILQDCSIRGIEEFDITGPNDDWKMKWTSEARLVYHHLIFRGKLGSLAHTLRYRIRPALKKLMSRADKVRRSTGLTAHKFGRE